MTDIEENSGGTRVKLHSGSLQKVSEGRQETLMYSAKSTLI